MIRKSQSHSTGQTGNGSTNSQNTTGYLSMSTLRHDAPTKRTAVYPPWRMVETNVRVRFHLDYNPTMPSRQAKTQPRRFLAPKCAKTAIRFGVQRTFGIWKLERGVLVLCWRSEARGFLGTSAERCLHKLSRCGKIPLPLCWCPLCRSEKRQGGAGIFSPKGIIMTEKRIVVWVQHFKDRDNLMLQWIDPLTGKRRSESAGTNNPGLAEMKRTDKEYELNHGLHKEVSRLSWERFRELFEEEYVAARRKNTRENYTCMFDALERLCHPSTLKSVTERMVSRFAAALGKEPGKARGSTEQAPSTIRQRLALLRTALVWAVRQKLIPELPHFPTIKVPKRKPQPIPAESFERLLAKADDATMQAFLLAGWLGGLRLHEAFALEWDENDKAPWLDLRRERIVFPATFAKAVEDQWVPLDPALREAVEALPRQAGRPGRHRRTRAPSGEGRRRQADHALAAERLRLSLCREGSGTSSPASHAPFEHQLDHDLLRQRR
jgi:integrase